MSHQDIDCWLQKANEKKKKTIWRQTKAHFIKSYIKSYCHLRWKHQLFSHVKNTLMWNSKAPPTVRWFRNTHYLKAVRGKITFVQSFMSPHIKPPVVKSDSSLVVVASSPSQKSAVNHVTRWKCQDGDYHWMFVVKDNMHQLPSNKTNTGKEAQEMS